ncbi:uncharacterized protein ACLA_084320 [Aspergillus clavatus NRRL 1]|uniref:Uncharacterized protein n=1 Tax=Aspergillus clavatus (strain ATCC 1007 / CBS 513.65 / DSM 816 / NCTC 3887 / NRRL 1 / QM 1276 / 107) TaxID=344612 RepID=A1CTV0_ASPCL|nr:uncharacterized protein ACLA_084320 [Aspergillus clavatus NRRL 1]EAW06737.1 hypothetical protein ACLA_084320 [Aspergillus clavatus NRRL 1]
MAETPDFLQPKAATALNIPPPSSTVDVRVIDTAERLRRPRRRKHRPGVLRPTECLPFPASVPASLWGCCPGDVLGALIASGKSLKHLLRKHGIPVEADRPGVGQDRQDQVFSGIVYRVNVPTGYSLGITEADVVQYDPNATGPLTNPGGEFGGFEKIPADLRSGVSKTTARALEKYSSDWPEIQYLSLSLFVGDLGSTQSPNDGYNHASLIGTLMTPTSRGNVSVSSSSMRRSAPHQPQLDDHGRRPLGHGCDSQAHAAGVEKPAVQALTIGKMRVVDGSGPLFWTPGEAPQSVVYMLAKKIADVFKKQLP